jgi:hypothetical protein
MKVRKGFVSNSSSSSFIVIGNGALDLDPSVKGYPWENMTERGVTEFGWDTTTYRGVYSRVNFAFLQAMSVKNQEWLDMIEKVIMEHTGATSVQTELSLDYTTPEGKVWGYIDHQSCATEGENTEMFASEEQLKKFMFANDSYIRGGNDNG